MPHRSYIETKLSEETYWESHEKEWLESLMQSPLYEQLKTQYDPESLDKNLKLLAAHRTRIYRLGPGILLDRQRKKFEYMPHAFQLIKEVQAKKLFNFGLLWRAEKIRVPGLWHTWQMHAMERDEWSTRFVTPFGEEDLLFLKHMVHDEAYTDTPQKWKFRHTMESSEKGYHLDDPDPMEKVYEFYPLLYERYDAWFNTGHLLHLEDVRSKAEKEYLAIYQEIREDKPEPVPDPEPGKAYHMDWTKYSNAWFLENEPHQVKQLFEAHELFFPDGWTAADYEYELGWEELLNADAQPYPRGDVNWKEATLIAGRRAFFAKVGEVLDDAFAEYKFNLLHNIPMDRSTDNDSVDFVPEPLQDQAQIARTHLGLRPFPDDYYL